MFSISCKMNDSGELRIVTKFNTLMESNDKNHITFYFLDEQDFEIKDNNILIPINPRSFEELKKYKEDRFAWKIKWLNL